MDAYILDECRGAALRVAGPVDAVLAARDYSSATGAARLTQPVLSPLPPRPSVRDLCCASQTRENDGGSTSQLAARVAPELVAAAGAVLTSASAAVTILGELDSKHRWIAEKTTALHGRCRDLAEETSKLQRSCGRIAEPLSAYDSFYVIGAALGLDFAAAAAKVAATVAPPAGTRLDGPSEHAEVDAAVAGAVRLLDAGLPMPHGIPEAALRELATRSRWSGPDGGAVASRASASPALSPARDIAGFAAALERIEACIGVLSGCPSHREAPLFVAKLRHLLLTALSQVKGMAGSDIAAAAGRALKNARALYAEQAAQAGRPAPAPSPAAATAAGAAAARSDGSGASAAVSGGGSLSQAEVDRQEVVLLQVGFRSDLSSPPLRQLAGLIEARCSGRGPAGAAGSAGLAARELKGLYELYARERARVLGESVWARLQRIVRAHEAASAAAAAAATASIADVADSAGSGASGGESAESRHARELLVIDAIRSACAAVARIAGSEFSLFHALFIAPPAHAGAAAGQPLPSPPAAAGADAAAGQPAGSPPALAASAHSLPSHVRSAADAAFQSLMDDACGLLVDALRPLLLSLTSLEALCDAVAVLKGEVIAEMAAPRGPQLAALARAAASLVQDVQERLVFLSQAYVNDAIEGFALAPQNAASSAAAGGAGASAAAAAAAAPSSSSAPPPAYRPLGQSSRMYEPLAAPVTAADGSRLLITGALVGGQGVSAPAGSPAAGSSGAGGRSGGGVGGGKLQVVLQGVPHLLDYPACLVALHLRTRSAAEAVCKPPSLYDGWFPVLETALLLLSRLQRALEGPSFEVMAQEIVAACTRVLLDAHRSIVGRAGSGALGGGGKKLVLSKLAPPKSFACLPPGAAGARASGSSGAGAGAGAGASAGAEAVPSSAWGLGSKCDAYLASRLRVERMPGSGSAATAGGGAASPVVAPGALSTGICAAAVNPWAAEREDAGADCLAALDGLLFLVRALLTLREQLSPYALAGGASVASLDFSTAGDSFGSLLANVGNVFRLSRDNPLLTFVLSALPRVADRRVDCKGQLEELLRSAADGFVTLAHTLVAQSLGAFVAEHASAAAAAAAAAASAAGGSGAAAGGGASPSDAPAAAAHIHMEVPAAKALLTRGAAAAADAAVAAVGVLPALRRRLGLFLGSAVTAAVLFRPVREALQRTASGASAAAEAVLRAGLVSGAAGDDAASLRALAAAVARGAGALSSILHASDQLIADPQHPQFGYDALSLSSDVMAVIAPASAGTPASGTGSDGEGGSAAPAGHEPGGHGAGAIAGASAGASAGPGAGAQVAAAADGAAVATGGAVSAGAIAAAKPAAAAAPGAELVAVDAFGAAGSDAETANSEPVV